MLKRVSKALRVLAGKPCCGPCVHAGRILYADGSGAVHESLEDAVTVTRDLMKREGRRAAAKVAAKAKSAQKPPAKKKRAAKR